MKKTIVAVAIACAPFVSAHAVEVNVNPLGLIFGALGGNALFKVSDNSNVKIGPSMNYWNVDTGTYHITATSFGVRLESGTGETAYDSGAFFAANAGYSTVTVTDSSYSSSDCEANASGIAATGLVGYGWYFDNNFSSKVGAGYTLGTADLSGECSDGSETNDSANISGLALEWTLGYRF